MRGKEGKEKSVQTVALVYQPALPEARRLAERCSTVVEEMGYQASFVSAWDLSAVNESAGVRLAVTYGGDGTIIRAARWLAGTGVPILGVALGKLGFMTELAPEAACDGLRAVLEGHYWVDERLMLRARTEPAGEADGAAEGGRGAPGERSVEPMIALNEVVVTRGPQVRVLHIDVFVDGERLIQYVADGVIVATPTGSTAYSLAAGGPVVAPGVAGLVIVPVAAHLTPLKSIVLPAGARVEIRASSDQPAVLALDGQRQRELDGEKRVWVEVAKESTLFARTGSPSRYYQTLVQNLKKR